TWVSTSSPSIIWFAQTSMVRGGDGVELSASVTTGSTVVRRVGGPRTRVAGDRLALGPGEHRLRLTLEAAAGGSVVVIAPATANQSAA
ncbi:DUF7311 family protein, partial [Haloferax volcanii]